MTVSKQAPGSPLAVTSNTVSDGCSPDWYWHHTKMTVICTTCSAVLHKGYCVCRCAHIIQRLLHVFALFLNYFWSHHALYGACIFFLKKRSTLSFQNTPFFSRRFMSMSFSTLCGSWSQSCIRTKGSLPFRLSLCQGLGLASRSETEPWVRPRIVSPNRRWPGWVT